MGWARERPPAGLAIGLLGPVVVGGRRGVMTPVAQPMLRVLIGLLGVAAGRAVSVPALIDGLWGEEWSPAREKNLHSRIWAVRRLFEEAEPGRGAARLVRSGEGYLVELDPGCLDIQEFRRLGGQGRAAARAGDMASAASQFGEALSLWRGAALDDAAHLCSRLAGEAASLEEARAGVVEDRLDCELALGRHGELVAELMSLAQRYPLRERLAGQLMVTLWRCGRRGEALAVYASTRRILAGELGLDPGPELRELHARVLADDPALADADGAVRASGTPAPAIERDAPPSGVTVARGKMPAPVASFVGRETELAELAKLIGRHRLVTITGPGGAGKTRLAIQVCAANVDGYRDGTWFVDLAELGDPVGVPAAIATALGIRLAPGEPVMPQLLDRASGMQAVLVVDNCEHLIDIVATTVEAVLENSPGVRVLATSRQQLGLPGENVWETPPIAFPSDQHRHAISELAAYDAVRLFIERMPHLHDVMADLRTIAQITATLEGLPLAIELAASPASRLGLAELSSMLSDRVGMSLLRSRTGHRRQQTLDATIGWSYDLLVPQMRSALRRLSVFSGGFTLEAAAAVVGTRDVAGIVDGLAERSLIVVDRDAGHDLAAPGGPLRYRMLETIRQYCADRIATEDGPEGDAVLRDAHAGYFADLAGRAAGPLTGPEQGRWLTALEADYANLVSALEHLLTQPGRAQDALRMIIPLDRYWHNRGHLADCTRFARRGLEVAGLDISPAVRCGVLNLVGQADSYHDVEAARTYLTEALEIARKINDPPAAATALHRLAWVCSIRVEREDSARFGAEALDIARRLGDPVLLAECLISYGSASDGQARQTAEIEALDVAVRSGDLVYAAYAHNNLADSALIEDDIVTARHHLEQAQKIFFELGAPVPMCLVNLGWVQLRQGEASISHGSFAEALRLAELQNLRRDGSYAILGLACVAAARGDAARAARLFGFADAELSGCGASWLVPEKTYRERWLTEVESQHGQASERLYGYFHGADRRDLVDYALSPASS